jgi:acetylglutamate kinase
MTKTWVIKLGGAVLNDMEAAAALIETFKTRSNERFVLVHGGGSLVDSWLKDAGFVTSKHLGLRISPREQMPYIVGALAGCANKQLLGCAIKLGVSATGITLFEAGIVSGQKLKALGQVGTCEAGNSQLIESLLAANVLPIVSSIGFDSDGQWYNVNADEAAAAIAAMLGAELIFMTDVAAVLGANGEPLHQLNSDEISQLIAEGVINGGMQVKVETSLHAANQLRRSVYISSWKQPQNLVGLLNGEHFGTQIIP